MSKQLNPCGQRMLIKPVEAAKQSKSGLILDNSTNNNAAKVLGIVIKFGDDNWNGSPLPWKVGDEIMFRRYSVDDLKIITDEGEKEFSLVDYNDVLGYFIN